MQHRELRTDRCRCTQHPASTEGESTSSIERENGETRRVNQKKTRTQMNMRTTRGYGETRCVICQNGYKNLQRILWMKVFQHTGTHPRVLLVHLPSREEKCYWASSVLRVILKDRSCDICLRTKVTRASKKTHWYSRAKNGKNGDLITADHKVLSEGCESRNNHRHAVVVQGLAAQWIQSYPCKKKNSQETEKSSQKFLKPTWKPRAIYTDNS